MAEKGIAHRGGDNAIAGALIREPLAFIARAVGIGAAACTLPLGALEDALIAKAAGRHLDAIAGDRIVAALALVAGALGELHDAGAWDPPAGPAALNPHACLGLALPQQ